MNKFYVILPVVLMAVFGYFYIGFSKEMKVKEAAKHAAKLKAEEAEAAKKKDLEEKARMDAQRRTEEREREEREREQARVARYEGTINKIQEELNRYKHDIDENTKLVAQLEKELADLRTRREKEGREALDLLKRVELAKVARRNAELEIQRYTEMVARRAAESAMARGAAVAAAPAK